MNSSHRSAASLRSLPWLAIFLFLDATSAFAQPRAPIGLSASYARLLLEEGTYPHDPGASDRFGASVASGDFNGDGYDDLAIGVPGNDRTQQIFDAGSVQLRFGAPTAALSAVLALMPWDNAVDPSEAFDAYGSALAAGDFDGDGYDDLAVGIPENDQFDGTSVISMGGVQLHLGRPNAAGGIQRVAEYSFSQVRGGGLPGAGSRDDAFGSALAFGDFNGDGRDDLAVGIPLDRRVCPSGSCQSGAAMVIDRDAAGNVGGYQLALGLDALPELPHDGDEFGRAVATGDFNADGFDDLAIGIPGRSSRRGAVLVVYGSEFSLIFADHQLLSQGEFGELPETGDRFGSALASGDFNGDGFDDLAMSAPSEDMAAPGALDAGQVIVAYGFAGGLSHVGAPWLSEDGIFGSGSEFADDFGTALAAGDFDADGIDDLAIGSGGENGPGGDRSGAVTVLLGRTQGLAGSTVRRLQAKLNPGGMIPTPAGASEVAARFGSALTSADFDGNGSADLAIGAWSRFLGANGHVGAVAVVFGQLFVDGFESADAFEWSRIAP